MPKENAIKIEGVNERESKRLRRFILIFSLILSLTFTSKVYATATLDNTAGTYTDDFANATGLSSKSQAGVNTGTGKVQLLKNTGSDFTSPFYTSGYVITSDIRVLSVAKWGTINITSTIPDGTSIKLQVMDDSDHLYSDSYLANNSTGISTFPVDISGIPPLYCGDTNVCKKPQAIRLKFTLTTTNTAVTPSIDALTFNWTTKQGDLSTQPFSDGPWPADGIDRQGTFHSRYANSKTYPAFKWAGNKHIGASTLDKLYVLSDKLFGYDSYIVGKMFGMNRDTGSELWNIPFARCSGPRGVITQNGTYYGTEIGCDLFYAIDTNTGQIKWGNNFYGGHGNNQATIGNDGTIFTIRSGLANVPSFLDQVLYAFNQDGTIKWTKQYSFGSMGDYQANTGSLSVGSDGTLYSGYHTNDSNYNSTNHGKLFALNPSDGSIKWQYNTGDLSSLAPIIDSQGIIYVTNTHYDVSNSSWEKKVYAINPDGALKWQKSLGVNAYSGIRSMSLRSDGVLLTLRSADAVWTKLIIEAINTSNGSTLWSQQTTSSYYISFTDSNNGFVFTDGLSGAGVNTYYTRINYYDASDNFKWRIAYLYNKLDGTNRVSYNLGPAVQDERGWLYGGLGKTYYDASTQIPSKEYSQVFALSPWSLSSSVNGSYYHPGDQISFTVTTSMLQTNPLFGGDNKVQVVMDNGDKVSLNYSSTDSLGNTIWTGTYTLPNNITDGSHAYTIEASQSYLQTDIATHFASASTESGNSGITVSGSFTVDNTAPTLRLKVGWNKIVWPSGVSKTADQFPVVCLAAVDKRTIFSDFFKNYWPTVWNFVSGKTYYIKCTSAVPWQL